MFVDFKRFGSKKKDSVRTCSPYEVGLHRGHLAPTRSSSFEKSSVHAMSAAMAKHDGITWHVLRRTCHAGGFCLGWVGGVSQVAFHAPQLVCVG